MPNSEAAAAESATLSETTPLIQSNDTPVIVYVQEIRGAKHIITCIFRDYALQIICATPGAFLAFLGGAGIKPDSLHSSGDLKTAVDRVTKAKITLGSLGLGAAFAVNASINIIYMRSSFTNMIKNLRERKISMLLAAFWAAGGVIANAQMSADAFNFIGSWKYIPFVLTEISFSASRFNGISSVIASITDKQKRFAALVLQYLQMNKIEGQIEIQLPDNRQPLSPEAQKIVTDAIIRLVRTSGFNSSRTNKRSWAQSAVAAIPSMAYSTMLAKLGAQGLFSLAQKELSVSDAAKFLPTVGALTQVPAMFFTTRSVAKVASLLTDFMISLYQNSRNRTVTRRIGWTLSALLAGAMSYFSSSGVSAEANELISEGWLEFIGIKKDSFGADYIEYGSIASIALINFCGLLQLIIERMHKAEASGLSITIDREAAIYFMMAEQVDIKMLFDELNGINAGNLSEPEYLG